MTDDDHVSIAVLPAREFDEAIAHGAYTRAGRRRVIHALVRAPGLQKGVQAHAESGTDAGEFERRAQQRLAHVPAVRGVVAIGEPHRTARPALIDELRGKHTVAAQRAPVDREHLVDDRETVALAQFAV